MTNLGRAMIWVSGAATPLALLCMGILPHPSGDASSGGFVLVAAAIMFLLGSRASRSPSYSMDRPDAE